MQPGYGRVSEIPPFMVETDMWAQHDLKYHHHHPHSPIVQQTPMQNFPQFHTIPITQQLFHHHTPVRLLLPHQLGIGPDNSTGGGEGGPPPTMSFKLAMGDDGSESRLRHWLTEDESASWRPLDMDYNKDAELETSSDYAKEIKQVQIHPADDDNYKVFSELEAIYKPGTSGSALTADDTTPTAPAHALEPIDPLVGGSTETSAGEEKLRAAKRKRKRRGKRKQQNQLDSIAAFLESLIKKLTDHQEQLHHKFTEAMEKREQERSDRLERWRKQETLNSCREATARSRERALAASREEAIVAFLEKITRERVDLPPKLEFPTLSTRLDRENDNSNGKKDDCYNFIEEENTNTTRWPKAEVEALIRVRAGLESRFQEPGLKGPLWDEVSSIMGAMGYRRNAKRCKEKWENINKYFRKAKESGKKRPENSKTCPYFHHLDKLYSDSSTTHTTMPSHRTDCVADEAVKVQPKRNSELLDAILGDGNGEELQVGNDDEERERDEVEQRSP